MKIIKDGVLKLFQYIFICASAWFGTHLYFNFNIRNEKLQVVYSASDALAAANTYIVYTTFICTIIALVSGAVGVVLSNAIYIKKRDILNELGKKLIEKHHKAILKDEKIAEAIIAHIEKQIEIFFTKEEFTEAVQVNVRDIAQEILDSDEMNELFQLKIASIQKEKIKYQSLINIDSSRQL